MPQDAFQREINYLRISVIDHCNLRCVYCMPLRGLSFVPSAELLTAVEIETVARAAVSVGFRKFRLTGGEPTLRADLLEIVRRIRSVSGVKDLSLTTNGALLPRLARPLKEAGLSRINIHIDTLNHERLKRVMRFGSLDDIWAGIEAAEREGLQPIKLNAVVVRDYNDEDVVDLARLTLTRHWHVRFVELMPFGSGDCSRLALTQFVPSSETRDRLENAVGPLHPLIDQEVSDESNNFRFDGAPGVIGFISPVSDPYCGTCNRMRLTSDGKLHLCLLNDDEIDLKKTLRNGGGESALADLLLQAVALKPVGHHLDEGRFTEKRSMFQLGG